LLLGFYMPIPPLNSSSVELALSELLPELDWLNAGLHESTITPETVFLNTRAKSRRKKPKEVDRVRVDLHETGGKLLAVAIDFEPCA
jgi:hypothetical protein